MSAAALLIKTPEDLAIERDHKRRGIFAAPPLDLDLAFAEDADLDDRFEATCLETGELLSVNGWLFSCELEE